MMACYGQSLRTFTRPTSARQCCVRSRSIGEFGPPPPPVPDIDSDTQGAYDVADDGKPMWLKDLERDVDYDPEVKELLDGAGSPEAVRERMAEYVDNTDDYTLRNKTGRPEPMEVSFREYDPAVAYFWLELYTSPSEDDTSTLEQLVGSWFIVGKLGGYNSMNLQVHDAATNDVSFMGYDLTRREDVKSYYHELGSIEARGRWLRFRTDLGTGDEVGLDILINMLQGCSEEYVGIKQLIIGGVNEDWPVADALSPSPEVTMNPMKGGSQEDMPQEDEAEEDDGEEMEDLLDQIRRDHPDKFEKLQRMQSQMNDLDL